MIKFLHVTKDEELPQVFKILKGSTRIAIDTETMAPRSPFRRKGFTNIYNLTKSGETAPFDPHTSEIRLMQLKGDTGPSIVIDLLAITPEGKEALSGFLGGLDSTVTWIGQNIRFDAKMIASNLGVWLDKSGAKVFDVMQASMLIANGVGLGRERGHRLVDLARDFLNVDLDKTEQASDWSIAKLTDEQIEYAALDVEHLHPLMDVLMESVKQLGIEESCNLDMSVVMPTARMEYNGLPLCVLTYRRVIEAASHTMPMLLGQIGKYFYDKIKQPLSLTYLEVKEEGQLVLKPFMLPWGGGKVGKDFLMSRANLVKGMIQDYGLVDDKGEPLESTEKAILETYREQHEGVGMLLDYWNLVKQSQFNYEDYCHPLTGRIHSRYTISGASTGRFTCSSINIQQTPARATMQHPDGSMMNFRQAFKAPKGYLFIDCDAAGQELSIMAAMSNEQVMIKALNENGDLHGEAASALFNIPLERVRDKKPGDPSNRSYRDLGKLFMFSNAYGKSVSGFEADWACSKEEAQERVNGFKKKFFNLAKWVDESGDIGALQSYSRLQSGALRFVGESKRADKDAAKRAAGNYQVQGPAAEQTKRAMILLDYKIQNEKLPMEIIACVHDELCVLAKYSENCKTAQAMLKEADTPELKAECLEHCKEENCAARYEGIVGESMREAGREILKDIVPAGFSVATCDHWKH